jgi:hypothetical protein
MGKKSSLIEYEEYSEEDAEADAEEQRNARGGAFFKFPEGKTRLRFIPAPKGKKWKVAVMEHFYDSPGVGTVKHICVKHATHGKRSCKSCRAETRLRKSDSPVDEARANEMRAKRRCYARAIVRSAEGDSGAKVVPFGPQIEGELTDLRNGGYDFTHPTKGCDVIVIKRTVNKRTNYKVVAASKGEPCKLADTVEEMNELIEGVSDLERFSRVPTDEQIDAILAGERPSRGDSPERSSSRRGRSVSEDLEDEEDDEEEDGAYADDDDEEITY